MLALGAATGFLTGVLAWVLIGLIAFVQRFAWGEAPIEPWQVVLVPTLGGLVVGTIVAYWSRESSEGVVTTMETIALHGGRFRLRVPFAGTLATGISLGTGASGGREGPIVLIGGAVGSALARLVAVDEDRTRALVAAGAAAGIGASFNAPIGGMLFAIELLLGGIRRAGSLQVVVVSSVVGSVTARQLVGEDLPIFRPRIGLELGAPEELLLYAALGLAAVAVASAFRLAGHHARRLFRALHPRLGRPLTVALSGFGVGLIALLAPEVLGDGSDLPPIAGVERPIQDILDGRYGVAWASVAVLLGLLVAKIVATSLSTAAGAAVGILAPTLFVGAALGGAFGIVAVQVLGADVDPGAFALVGMAAVFAAAARTPLTAILIVFELTGSYSLVLPLMVAVGIATFGAEAGGSVSVYLQELRERGVLFAQVEGLDVLQTVTVGEVMTRDHPTIQQHATVPEVRERLDATGSHGFAVVDDDGRLVGVVTRRDLVRPGATARDICTDRVLTVSPDDPVFRAVRRMATLDVGRIPVVDPTTRELVGVLRRADVVRAYQRGINRSLSAQQRRSVGRLRDLAGVDFIELVLDSASPSVGRAVREIPWPERTVLTSVRRTGEVLVPTGDTVLEAGDELVVLTGEPGSVRELLAPPE